MVILSPDEFPDSDSASWPTKGRYCVAHHMNVSEELECEDYELPSASGVAISACVPGWFFRTFVLCV
ncbi:hypothetical protein ScPMuIL_014558 [Solemya velum]